MTISDQELYDYLISDSASFKKHLEDNGKYSFGYVKNAYKKLGSPLSDVNTVLVAGTNGKGTTAGIIVAICHQLKIKTALYSSPHLFDLTERCFIASDSKVNSNKVKNTDFQKAYLLIKNRLDKDLFNKLSKFELLTLTSFIIIDQHKKNIDLAVIEVGLGGDLDATNIIENLDASIICSIGCDHKDILGDSLVEIAGKKSGVKRKNKPLLIGENCLNSKCLKDFFNSLDHDQKIFVFKDYYKKMLKSFESLNYCADQAYFNDFEGFKKWLPGSYICQSTGKIYCSDHMLNNFVLALKTVEVLNTSLNLIKSNQCKSKKLSYQDLVNINQPLIDINIPSFVGRSMLIKTLKFDIYLDVAHNSQAIDCSLSYYKLLLQVKKTKKDQSQTVCKSIAVLSLLKNKDFKSIVKTAFKYVDKIILTTNYHFALANRSLTCKKDNKDDKQLDYNILNYDYLLDNNASSEDKKDKNLNSQLEIIPCFYHALRATECFVKKHNIKVCYFGGSFGMVKQVIKKFQN